MFRRNIIPSCRRQIGTFHARFSTNAAASQSTQSVSQSSKSSKTKPVTFNVKPMPAHRSRLEPWHYDVNKPLHPRPLVQSARQSQGSSPIEVRFRVNRTASLQLPVYLQRPGPAGTQVVTRIRSVQGDINELAREVQIMLGPNARVEARVGRVNIKGNYVQPVKQWLTQLGF